MAYIGVDWRNKPDHTSPINRTNLEIMDNGISQAHSFIKDLQSELDADADYKRFIDEFELGTADTNGSSIVYVASTNTIRTKQNTTFSLSEGDVVLYNGSIGGRVIKITNGTATKLVENQTTPYVIPSDGEYCFTLHNIPYATIENVVALSSLFLIAKKDGALQTIIGKDISDIKSVISADADYKIFYDSFELGTVDTSGSSVVYLNSTNTIRTKRGTTLSLKAGDIIWYSGTGGRIIKMTDGSASLLVNEQQSPYVIPSDGEYIFTLHTRPATTVGNVADLAALFVVVKQNGILKTITDQEFASLEKYRIVDIFDNTQIELGTIYMNGSSVVYGGTTTVARTKQGLTLSLVAGDEIVTNKGWMVRVINYSTKTQITNYTVSPVPITENGEYVFAVCREAGGNVTVDEIIQNVYVRRKKNIERTEIAKIAANYDPSEIFSYKGNGKVQKVIDTYYNVAQDIEYTHVGADGFQSCDIYNNKLYVASSENKIIVYDIGTSAKVKELSVSLGHANSCQFSDEFYNDNTIPLLYVADYYLYVVYVVNILADSAEIIRTITMPSSDTGERLDASIDVINNRLIMMGYKRTTPFDRTDNNCIISVWDLSNLELNSGIDYTPALKKKFDIHFVFCTADCIYHNNILYVLSSADPTMVTQYGENKTRIYCINVNSEVIEGYMSEMPTYYANREVEGITIWNDKIFLLPFGGNSGLLTFNE